MREIQERTTETSLSQHICTQAYVILWAMADLCTCLFTIGMVAPLAGPLKSVSGPWDPIWSGSKNIKNSYLSVVDVRRRPRNRIQLWDNEMASAWSFELLLYIPFWLLHLPYNIASCVKFGSGVCCSHLPTAFSQLHRVVFLRQSAHQASFPL